MTDQETKTQTPPEQPKPAKRGRGRPRKGEKVVKQKKTAKRQIRANPVEPRTEALFTRIKPSTKKYLLKEVERTGVAGIGEYIDRFVTRLQKKYYIV